MNIERDLIIARAAQPDSRPAPGARTPVLRVVAILVALAFGGLFASAAAAGGAHAAASCAEPGHAEPGFVFESIEDAAVDALAHAHRTAAAGDRGRFRIGTIRRASGGFTYTEAKRSNATVWHARPATLRYAMGPDDVASFIVHPRSGNARIDRANEAPNRSERRLVDRLDSMQRPLFVLTPSLRVLRYAERRTAEVADLRDPARVPVRPVVVAAREQRTSVQR